MQKIKWTKVWIFDQKMWGCWIEHFNDSNAFIECSNTMDDIYEDIADYNPNIQKKKSLNRVWWYDCGHYGK